MYTFSFVLPYIGKLVVLHAYNGIKDIHIHSRPIREKIPI